MQFVAYASSVFLAAMLVMFAAALVGFAIGYWVAFMLTWAVVAVIATGVFGGITAASADS